MSKKFRTKIHNVTEEKCVLKMLDEIGVVWRGYADRPLLSIDLPSDSIDFPYYLCFDEMVLTFEDITRNSRNSLYGKIRFVDEVNELISANKSDPTHIGIKDAVSAIMESQSSRHIVDDSTLELIKDAWTKRLTDIAKESGL